jgi:6-phosphogluconolactonase
MPPDIRILEDAEQIAGEAAQEFWGAVEEGIRSRGAPAVALSGGSTPRTLYTLLAQLIRPERGRLV